MEGQFSPGDKLKVLSEATLHTRYIEVRDRRIAYPGGNVFSFDVAGSRSNGSCFVVICPVDTSCQEVSPPDLPIMTSAYNDLEDVTISLSLEYQWGPNEFLYSLPAGGVSKAHASILQAAQWELSEEAGLLASDWSPLSPREDGIPELKWGTNRFFPFLAMNCTADNERRPMDAEEEGVIQCIRGVSIPQAMSLALSGRLHLPSLQTLVLAVEELRKRRERE